MTTASWRCVVIYHCCMLVLLPSLLTRTGRAFPRSTTTTTTLPYTRFASTTTTKLARRSMSSSSQATTAQQTPTKDIMFGKFVIPASCVFYQSNSHNSSLTTSSYAFVNLRPIVPGHVLVVPQERVATMAELSLDAYLDMWTTVRTVQAMLRKHYTGVTAFNVAVQDGRAAGQSVPHVHVHILPRTAGDYEENDEIYTDLETWAPRPELQVVTKDDKNARLQVPADGERRDRTNQEMAEEATVYRKILSKEMP
eukprot:scaffold1294_cov167-Amphora_coffeaeformis.AAC.13